MLQVTIGKELVKRFYAVNSFRDVKIHPNNHENRT